MAEDHYSLSAKVFHSIREDILNGKYQANEELKEKNIGDDLGVSRTPVREALRQLNRLQIQSFRRAGSAPPLAERRSPAMRYTGL